MGDVQIRLACWAAWKSAWKVEKWGLKRKEEKSGGSSPGKAPLFGLVYSFSATLRAFLNSKDEIEESANKWMQETAKLLIYSVCEKNFFYETLMWLNVSICRNDFVSQHLSGMPLLIAGCTYISFTHCNISMGLLLHLDSILLHLFVCMLHIFMHLFVYFFQEMLLFHLFIAWDLCIIFV